MFSRRKGESNATPAAADHDAPTAAAGAVARRWPWEPDQSVAAQLAISSLVKFLPKSLARNDRLQAETLFCVIGALTGFAAQYALRQEHLASGEAKESDIFVTAEAPNGERYFFGDRLNAILVPETLESLTVFSVLGGEALKLGAAKEELSDCHDIFERTAKSIGTPGFGVPELPPGHKPFLMPRRAVEIFWPSILNAFTREPIVPVPGFKLVAPRHWPLVLAAVAASFMPPTKGLLAPVLALQIFMEAAISMSKIDQSAVRFVGATEH
jgi:hypothetical protein